MSQYNTLPFVEIHCFIIELILTKYAIIEFVHVKCMSKGDSLFLFFYNACIFCTIFLHLIVTIFSICCECLFMGVFF